MLDDIMRLLKAQVLSLASVLALMACVARFAALRGTKRRAFPPIVDKALRLCFYLALVGPSYALLPRTRAMLAIVSCLYLPSYLDGSEKRGGKMVRSVNVLHRLIKKQLSLALVKTVDLDPKQQYLIGLHPHGILPFGGIINCGTEVNKFSELFPGIDLRQLAASFCFYIPIYREVTMRMGIRDAARYSAKAILAEGKSILLVPGGATEALYAAPDTNVLYLRKRLGFIKLAIETGAHLVPAFSFGETDTFAQMSTDYAAVRWLKSTFQYLSGFSLPLISNIIPRKSQVTTVIGRPIPVEKVENPTDQQVAEMLDRYIEAVKALYAEYQPKYQPKAAPLKII